MRQGLNWVRLCRGKKFRYRVSPLGQTVILSAARNGRPISSAAGGSAVILAGGSHRLPLSLPMGATHHPARFTAVIDPSNRRFVAILNKPGGNVKGVAAGLSELGSKALGNWGCMNSFPRPRHRLASEPLATRQCRKFDIEPEQTPPRRLGLEILVSTGSSPRWAISSDLSAIAVQQRPRSPGWFRCVFQNHLTNCRRWLCATRCPTSRPSVLGSNGVSLDELRAYATRRVSARPEIYVGRILKGEKPGESTGRVCRPLQN